MVGPPTPSMHREPTPARASRARSRQTPADLRTFFSRESSSVRHPLVRWLCLTGVLTCFSAAQADAPLNATQLHEFCRAWHNDPDSVAAASCAAYVQGFLDGAADIDERTASGRDQRTETFTDRARRTRLGRTYPGRPPYCVARGTSLSGVIDQLLVYCETQRLDRDVSARTLLARVLGQFYPCR